jgi:HEAT repeat protein
MKRLSPVAWLLVLIGCGPTPTTLSGGKSVSHWIAELQAPGAKQRQTAVFKLGNVGSADPAAFPAVLGALKDREARVRAEAILAVMKFGAVAQEALPALNDLRADPDAEVRSRAARALQRLAEDSPRGDRD